MTNDPLVIDRVDLVDVLRRVQPAVAPSSVIPVLRCFCFDQRAVFAYDDSVAVHYPMPTGLAGAFQASVLLPWLAASKATSVKVTPEPTGKDAGASCTFTAGRSRLRLPMLPLSDSVFEMPELSGKGGELPWTEDLFSRLEAVTVTMGNDPTIPWQLGVTVVPREGRLTLFTTDNRAASRAEVELGRKGRGWGGAPVILPPRFCTMLLSFARSDKPASLSVTEDWVVARFESGMLLFARSVRDVRVTHYLDLWKRIRESVARSGAVEKPKGLERCLERSTVVLDAETRWSTMRLAEGVLQVVTEGQVGRVRERVGMPGHPDIEMRVSPEMLLRVLPEAVRVCITNLAVYVERGDGVCHVVSAFVH